MSDTWLILDCPYLAHRAAHALGELSSDDSPTTVVFGLMRDLVGWRETFGTEKVAFCFDAGRNKRLDIYQRYKENRAKRDGETEEQKQNRELVRYQIERLRDADLYRLGYRNVFWADGYEADDVIASVAMFSIPDGDEAVVVSSDSDLWQLISARVSVFDPRTRKRRTLQWFSKTWGLSPCQWADVKAIAGCGSDNVRGVEQVGEKSAAAFLSGRLPQDHFRYKAIVEDNERWRRNLRLVQLPFEGCPQFELCEDRVSRDRWEGFCRRYGMRSLRVLYPGR